MRDVRWWEKGCHGCMVLGPFWPHDCEWDYNDFPQPDDEVAA